MRLLAQKVNTMNRIEAAIKNMGPALAKLDTDTLETVSFTATVQRGYDLGLYQQTQAQAFAAGLLNQDEAQSLYNILGCGFPTVEKFNRQPLAVRVVAMKTVAELMRANHATA